MWPTLVCSLWVKIWTNYLIKLNAWWSTASLPQVKYVLRWVLFLRHIELGEDNSTLRQESNKTRAEVDFNWCRTYTMVDRFSSHGFTAKPELVCANGTITHKYCFMGFFYCSSLNQFVWVGQPYAYVVLWFFLLLELEPVCVSGTAVRVRCFMVFLLLELEPVCVSGTVVRVCCFMGFSTVGAWTSLC